jgi:uncharacterized protein (UPF0332 family)
MPSPHPDWIAFAKTLVGSGSEIAHRTAASRGYYSAFHACRSLAAKLPDPQDSNGMHDRDIRAMCEYPVTAANRDTAMAIRKVGYIMKQCRSLRTKADYRIDEDFLQTEAEETIAFAEKVIAAIQTIKFP